MRTPPLIGINTLSCPEGVQIQEVPATVPSANLVPVKSSSLPCVRIDADTGAAQGGSVGRVLPYQWGVQGHPSVERKVGRGREMTEIGNTNILQLCVCMYVHIINIPRMSTLLWLFKVSRRLNKSQISIKQKNKNNFHIKD